VLRWGPAVTGYPVPAGKPGRWCVKGSEIGPFYGLRKKASRAGVSKARGRCRSYVLSHLSGWVFGIVRLNAGHGFTPVLTGVLLGPRSRTSSPPCSVPGPLSVQLVPGLVCFLGCTEGPQPAISHSRPLSFTLRERTQPRRGKYLFNGVRKPVQLLVKHMRNCRAHRPTPTSHCPEKPSCTASF
jgi:hypothetical protein